jgi:hypothetical protein
MRSRKANAAQIKLGDGWRQFAFAQPDLEFIGVIRRGMEIGALAQDKSGAFWQVNGDMRQTLNTSRMTALLKAAKPETRKAPITRQPSAEQRSAVVVTVKPKRRIIVRD